MRIAKEQLILYHADHQAAGETESFSTGSVSRGSASTGTAVCEQLATMLTELGFIGKPLPQFGSHLYQTGEAFFDHLVYLGCSPVVHFAGDAEADEPPPTCVAIDAGTKLVYGSNTVAPRCGHCKNALHGWTESLHAAEHEPAVVCSHCMTPAALSSLNWRKRAALGSSFVKVHGVFPHEAVPGETLLTRLQALTGDAWRYSYVQQPVVIALDEI